MLPLLIDLRGWKAVVFGGGQVGMRKANYLAEEAEVTVVSREFVDGFADGITKVRAEIGPDLREWVERADIVVAATDDRALNDEIALAATSLGRPCNRADAPSTFMIPSVVRRKNYLVAVSTLGRSPAMSRYLRSKLEAELDEGIDRMVALQEKLREEAKGIIPEQRDRERLLWEVIEDPAVWDALSRGEEEALRTARDRLVRQNGNGA